MMPAEALQHIAINDVGDRAFKPYPNIIYLPPDGELEDMRWAGREYLPPDQEHPGLCCVVNNFQDIVWKSLDSVGHQREYTAVAFETKAPFGSLQSTGGVLLLWSETRREWAAITRDFGYVRDGVQTAVYKGAYAIDAHCKQILHDAYHVPYEIDEIDRVPPADLYQAGHHQR